MSAHDRPDYLGKAFANAMRDAFASWRRENASSEAAGDAFAMWVQQIDVSATYAPGGRGWIVVSVKDRRPGREHQESYLIAAKGGAAHLERCRGEV